MRGEGVIIVNPLAAHGRAGRLWPKIEAELSKAVGRRPVVWLSRAPGHAVELAERAVDEGFDWVAACGGDGTVHEVVNGLCRKGADGHTPRRPALVVIPAGTGNDFARALGMPRNPLEVAMHLARVQRRTVDVGRVGDRFFANVGGVGFDAEVAAEVNRGRKIIRGALPYVWAVFKKLLTYRNESVEILIDGRPLPRKILLVAVGLTPFYAGGMRMLPFADMGDGLLDICICGDLRRRDIVVLLPRIFSGRHVEHELVECYRARTVRVVGPSHLHVHADGEIVGTLPTEFRCIPGALEVWCPATPNAAGLGPKRGDRESSSEIAKKPASASPPN